MKQSITARTTTTIILLSALFAIASLFTSCSNTPDYLTLKWAKHIRTNPPGKKEDASIAKKARDKFDELAWQGLFHKNVKKDNAKAIQIYEQALNYYATGRIYFHYGNSLSNIPRLKDAVKAYKIARKLGYKKDGVVAYNTACAYSRLDDTKNAALYIGKALWEGYPNLTHIKRDKDLKNLRSSKDWEAVQKKIRKYSLQMHNKTIQDKILKAVQTYDLPLLYKLKRKLRILYLSKKEGIAQFDRVIKKQYNKDPETNKYYTFKKKDIDILYFLSRYILHPNNKKDKYSKPLLIEALENKFPNTAMVLIERGAHPNTKYQDPHFNEYSALKLAIDHRYLKVVRALLARGAKLNTQFTKGQTSHALLYAVKYKSIPIIKTLLQAGADPLFKDTDKTSAFQLAVLNKQHKIIKLLRRYMPPAKNKTALQKARAFFLKNYTMRYLTDPRNGRSIAFKAGLNFIKNGVGRSSAINPPKSNLYPSVDMLFHLYEKRIEFSLPFAYLTLKRPAPYKPAGKKGLYLSGHYFKVGKKISSLQETTIPGRYR